MLLLLLNFLPICLKNTWARILLVFFLNVGSYVDLHASQHWKGEVSGGFSAQINVSSLKVMVPQTIEIELILRYPDSHIPDLENLIKRISQPINPYLPSYKVINKTVTIPLEMQDGLHEQVLKVTISPEAEGDFLFSFLNIPFNSLKQSKYPPIQLFSKVFILHSATPPPSDPFIKIAPLLSVTPDIPLSLSLANREILMNDPMMLEQEAERNRSILSSHSFPWIWVVGVSLLGIFTLLFKRIKKFYSESALRPSHPIENAIETFAKLKQIDWHTAPSQDLLYHHLFNAVRVSIEKTLQINALEKTTEEFLFHIREDSGVSFKLQTLIINFFKNSDLIKFGQYRLSSEEWTKEIAQAERLILELSILTSLSS